MLTFLALAALAFSAQTSALPNPSGSHKIGKTELKAHGESILIWYPAKRAGTPGSYAPKEEISLLAKTGYYDQSADVIQHWENVQVHSTENADPESGRHRLLILLPGAGVCGFQYTALAEDFASHGYVVAVIDYYSPTAPERKYDPNDWGAANDDLARLSTELLQSLKSDAHWRDRIYFNQVAIAGHSIGGSAAIAASRNNPSFLAAIDMDGAPFGEATKGALRPVLVLRSKPIYSDADLAKRGKTRTQMDDAGEEARKTWLDFKTKSPSVPVLIYSVKGTGHFSFSDAPFTMPDAITRFGGEIIQPSRGETVISECLHEFLDQAVHKRANWKLDKCEQNKEIVAMPLTAAR